jgi:hypothetical protein
MYRSLVDGGDDRDAAAESENVGDTFSGVGAVEYGGDVRSRLSDHGVAGLRGRRSELTLGIDEVARHAEESNGSVRACHPGSKRRRICRCRSFASLRTRMTC